MIVVTGATGQLGRLIVDGLLQIIPGSELGVSVQNPERAGHLQQRGVRVCKGDFGDRASLPAAFEGAEQVLIISVNKFGEEAVQFHDAAIKAAAQAGAKRILYTSHQGASSRSAFVPAVNHAVTEALLVTSGVPFVSLRNGFYAESALFQLAGLKQSGRIVLPMDGPVSWTSRSDLARAAISALLQPGLFDGISPPLTGSEALDFQAIAELASALLDREIVRETITDQQYRGGLLAHGVPAGMADGLGSLYKASRAGEFDVVSPALQNLLGHKPVAMTDVLRSFLAENPEP